MKKRLLVILLALCLTLALLPAAALAADSDFLIENGVLKQYKGSGGDVVIPDGVTEIGRQALQQKWGITSVTIPDSVTVIGANAFQGCTNMTEVSIGSGVTSIGISAFDSCKSLTSVTIPDGVQSIDKRAFVNCTNLTSVTIPNSVTYIGDWAFMECSSLKSVTIPGGFTKKPGESSERIFEKCTSLTTVVFLPGVQRIFTGMFGGCSSLTSVTIPKSVTMIDDYVFAGCTSLTDVYYEGTEKEWLRTSIDETNMWILYNAGTSQNAATIHYNSTGPTDQPTTPDQPTTRPTVENIPATGTAAARTQNVLLDGKTVQFQCYAVKDDKGNESNYVKIRDLAQALNGTKAQFNVGWDGKISITSNTPYQTVGGEGSTPYSGDQPYTAVSNTPVSFNGSDVNLTSFQLKDSAGNGYTYYKLRDLGQLLNFNVTWNGRVVVESDKPYTG